MTNHDDTTGPDAGGYDPDTDPDADPDSLNPRDMVDHEGGPESSSVYDGEGDTDADPETLNPRETA